MILLTISSANTYKKRGKDKLHETDVLVSELYEKFR